MPIYEYRCMACSHEFEMMQKFSDPPLEQCPSCAGKVNKLISRSAFHLKGSGWYVTDYGRSGSQSSKSDTNTNNNSETSSSSTDSTASSTKDAASKDTTKTSTAAA
jgi:putative FmdB family regulatory protein